MQYSLICEADCSDTSTIDHLKSPAKVTAIQPVIFDLFVGGHIARIEVIVALEPEPLWS